MEKNYNYNGEIFLDKIFKELYLSKEVQHKKSNKDTKYESIKKYLERLNKIHKKSLENKNNLLKELYYKQYVIKEENISTKLTKEEKQSIIDNQKKSLEKWLNYLTDEKTKYPLWQKYWIFQGMLKIGTYDEANETFQNRSKKTTAPFIEINEEVIEQIVKIIDEILNDKKLNNKEIEKLIEKNSFKKLYTILEKNYKKNKLKNLNNTNGIWIKYKQNNKEDAIKLSKSLENKNTGWCTAREETAIIQVCGCNVHNGGDFYVYYTLDEKNNYTIPRIAIRMKDNNIEEIRGIEESQNLEESMIQILEKKLEEFNDITKEQIKKNIKISNDLKELTKINKKVAKKEELNIEEIKNIYLKDYGFGIEQEPRIKRIIIQRDIEKDYKMLDKEDKIKFLVRNIKYLNKNFIIEEKEVLIEAIKYNSNLLIFASEKLKNDKEIVLMAVKKDGLMLEYASEKLKNDKEIVMKAIENKTMSLKYASNEIKNDKEIVLIAVEKNGLTLEFVNNKLKNDKEIITNAVLNNYESLKYASEEIKKDKKYILELIKITTEILKYIDEELKKDNDLFCEAIKLNPGSLKHASEKIIKKKS